MNKTFVTLLLIALLIFVAGCGQARPATQTSAGDRDLAPAPAQPAAPGAKSAEGSYDATETGGQTQSANQPQAANAAAAERMIVYTGRLSLIVKDANATVEQITQIVKDVGGFVVSSNTYKDQGHTRASMTVRVPGEDLAQLKTILSKIEAQALQVESRQLDGQDVTDQYADNQAEIENLTAQRNSYRNLLDRATKMEDILSIQTRLDQVQGQINKLTGQQLKIKESVKLATVSIDITPDALAQPFVIGTWRPEGTALAAFHALLNALKLIGDVLIWSIICVLPVALLLGVPVYLLGRFAASRRRAARKATPPPPKTQA